MDDHARDLLICSTCGQQTDRFTIKELEVPTSERVPCPICADPRQWIPPTGQEWTTLGRMQGARKYKNQFESTPGDDSLASIHSSPAFAIGQRAILVQTPEGNILWDCITYLDDDTIESVNKKGGIKHICISHPHFFATAVLWADVFNATLWINAADIEWLQRIRSEKVRLWQGSEEVLPGYTLVQVGAHFPGSCVLHTKEKSILTADSVMVVQSGLCSILWSYPNMIPAPPQDILGVWKALEKWEFDRIHAGWLGKDILADGKAKLRKSIEQILRQMAAERELAAM